MWEDRQIAGGDAWKPEIEEALESCSVALLLISTEFLTSQFILADEVPTLLRRREEEGLRVIPVILKPSAWDRVSWLSPIQARPDGGKALSGMSEYDADLALTSLAKEVVGVPPRQGAGQRDLIVPSRALGEKVRALRAVVTALDELPIIKSDQAPLDKLMSVSIWSRGHEALVDGLAEYIPLNAPLSQPLEHLVARLRWLRPRLEKVVGTAKGTAEWRGLQGQFGGQYRQQVEETRRLALKVRDILASDAFNADIVG